MILEILLIIIGFIFLIKGADFLVKAAVSIAKRFGLSEMLIGLTIVAVGTSLPEIITGIISAKKDETDLLLGNISGSNIINLCLLVGIGAVINPLTFATDFNSALILLIVVTILLQLIATFNKKSELDRKRGIILIIVYFIYIFTMI